MYGYILCILSARRRVRTAHAARQVLSQTARKHTILLAYPYRRIQSKRNTLIDAVQIVKGTMWSFEQPQSLAFSNVVVNVRMTVTLLSSGALLVYNPIAPTRECLRFLDALDAPVAHIILGSAAYEHKVFVGPFSRRYPKAKVYVAPQQYAFPLPLPLQLLGIFPEAVLKHNDKNTPWAEDFEQKMLAAPPFAVAGVPNCCISVTRDPMPPTPQLTIPDPAAASQHAA